MKQEQKHTPGPWKYARKPSGTMAVYADTGLYEGKERIIANIQHSESDARLIAAAPELLAALKRATNALDWYMNDIGECDNEALDLARAALRKATES